MKVEVPEWFDNDLVSLLEKKIDRSKIKKQDRTLDWVLRQILKACPSQLTGISTKKFTWEDIETIIEEGSKDLQSKYSPDLIIGVKSGGAFIANYVAKCLDVKDVDYMRISHYSDKSRSVVKSAVTSYDQPAIIKEEPKKPVLEKKVLLVDDQTATGATLKAGTEYLKEKGVKDVKTFCLYSARPKPDFRKTFQEVIHQLKEKSILEWDFSLCCESPEVDFYVREGMIVYTPWGKDA